MVDVNAIADFTISQTFVEYVKKVLFIIQFQWPVYQYAQVDNNISMENVAA